MFKIMEDVDNPGGIKLEIINRKKFAELKPCEN